MIVKEWLLLLDLKKNRPFIIFLIHLSNGFDMNVSIFSWNYFRS